MKRLGMLLLGSLFCLVFLASCAPVTVQKCYEEYKYTEDGKVKQRYKECITQVPEKMPPIHLKHQDLYE